MPNLEDKSTKYVIGDVISGCVKSYNGKSYITDDEYSCNGTLTLISGAIPDTLLIPIEYVEEVKEEKGGSTLKSDKIFTQKNILIGLAIVGVVLIAMNWNKVSTILK